jgi:hypothetical protein
VATGRIGVTPVLRTRWSDQPTAGTTVLSGLDDNSVALVYDAGYEAVYRNGVLLSRGNDYTATDGTTITLIDATLAGDIIEVFANDLVPLTDAISKGQYNAKGALLSASAAATPGVLAVGANNTVLTADSTTATGLKWAAPAGGGKILQVIQGTTTASTVSTSTSFVDSGLSASITPSATSSRIIVIVYHPACGITGSSATGMTFNIMRNSTQISFDSDNFLCGATSYSQYRIFPFNISIVDSPSTTSAITYKTQLQAVSSSNTIGINTFGTGVSRIILMEVSA